MPVQYSEHSSGPSSRRSMLTEEMVKDLGYYVMSKTELQDEAEARGLPKSGTKDALIQRLQESD